MKLAEKYRPATFEEFIGNDKVRGQIESLNEEDLTGAALWIEGPTGTGKTTLAHLVAKKLRASVVEIDGEDCTIDAVREIDKKIAYSDLFSASGWRVYIVNEAHEMTKKAVAAWLTLLERLPAKRLVVFTTTESLFESKQETLWGEHSHPFISRTMDFRLTAQGLMEPFALRVKEIAMIEGKDGQPIERYKRLAKDCCNNFRWMLNKVQAGAMLA